MRCKAVFCKGIEKGRHLPVKGYTEAIKLLRSRVDLSEKSRSKLSVAIACRQLICCQFPETVEAALVDVDVLTWSENEHGWVVTGQDERTTWVSRSWTVVNREGQ